MLTAGLQAVSTWNPSSLYERNEDDDIEVYVIAIHIK